MNGSNGKTSEDVVCVVQRVDPECSIVDSASVDDVILIYSNRAIAIFDDFPKDKLRPLGGTIHDALEEIGKELRGSVDEEKRSSKRKEKDSFDGKRSRKDCEAYGNQHPCQQQQN